jgi:predicted aspartyl protease
MGEVRVKVTLTNAQDESLARSGKGKRKKVRSYVADALVDTGAVRSVLPAHVVHKLGLGIRGHEIAEYADGRKDRVDVTEGVVFDLLDRDCLEDALVLGDNVWIGRTVLAKLDLQVDCKEQRIFPNPAHPDQPVNKVK